MKKLISLICCVFLVNSCALMFNKKDVEVSFKSYPDGAKVWLNGEVIGETPISTRIKPVKDYSILYTKDGYANREFGMKLRIGHAGNRSGFEKTMCALDGGGIILILPLFSLISPACSDFTESSYFKALDKGNRINVIEQPSN